MKNSADQGECYPPRPITPSEICRILHILWKLNSKYFPVLKGVSPFRSLFFCSPKITQSLPQFFFVNGSIICSGLHFWRHCFNMTKILSKFGQQQLVMVNYACGFNQSETGKYFEWIIIIIIFLIKDSCTTTIIIIIFTATFYKAKKVIIIIIIIIIITITI